MWWRIGGAVVLAAGLLGGCSVVGDRSGSETPSYEVVRTLGEDIEIRDYPERAAVGVTVAEGGGFSARSRAFRALFRYISGDNQGGEEVAMTVPVETGGSGGREIDMTVPVETAAEADRLRMRFFLPSAYTARTAPRPTEPGVDLERLPPVRLAVLRFTGFWTESILAEKTRALRERLNAAGIDPTGPAIQMFYDPPFSIPWLRRNEVAFPIPADAS